ncbi:hypothetical protein ACQUW5_02910 [Legionella sp. CNM-1927-20]|uniref:hypothetical protein n=1 Tax=Legionella sp. CNM-1927-20 TaxID=3422221 RepID=UPI00403AF944
MEISNQSELIKSVEKVSEILQDIQNYCRKEQISEAKIKFPRGFLRTCNNIRNEFNFISESHLKSNIAYTIQLSDSIRWLLIRTDIAGTAKSMLIKLYIVLIGAVIESCTKNYLKGKCGKCFSKRNEFLYKKGIISKKLMEDLNYVWTLRSNIHLMDITSSEYENDYSISTLNRCVRAFFEIRDILNTKPEIRTK